MQRRREGRGRQGTLLGSREDRDQREGEEHGHAHRDRLQMIVQA